MNLKQIDYEQISYKLRSGQQRSTKYLALNPQGLVPALETDHGEVLFQSLAIIDYLDKQYAEPRLIPLEPLARARVLGIALSVACDLHPLNNLRVLKHLKERLLCSEDAVVSWIQHWVATEFESLENRLECDSETGTFCHGDQPTLADVCLVPQVYNAERYHCDLSAYANILRISAACREINAFMDAAPENQSDAV